MSGSTPSKLLGLFAYGNMNVAMDKIAKRRGVLVSGAATFSVDDYHAPDQPMLDEMTAAAPRAPVAPEPSSSDAPADFELPAR